MSGYDRKNAPTPRHPHFYPSAVKFAVTNHFQHYASMTLSSFLHRQPHGVSQILPTPQAYCTSAEDAKRAGRRLQPLTVQCVRVQWPQLAPCQGQTQATTFLSTRSPSRSSFNSKIYCVPRGRLAIFMSKFAVARKCCELAPESQRTEQDRQHKLALRCLHAAEARWSILCTARVSLHRRLASPRT